MAEEVKPQKKEEAAPAKPEVKEEISGWTIIGAALLLSVVATRIGSSELGVDHYLSPRYLFSILPESVQDGLRTFAFSYIVFTNFISLFFLIGLVYSLVKLIEVEKKWYAMLYPEPVAKDAHVAKNSRWELVQAHIATDNPSDWRLAILEADIILDDLLDHLGFVGDTIGDKLKKAVRGDFETIDSAWEAHKIRNAIAHEGQDFVLTQREAQRIIALYQNVFKEFDYI